MFEFSCNPSKPSRIERVKYFLSMLSVHGADNIKPKHLTGIIGGITHQKHPTLTG
nr:MAG TPA: hypothetical protein [Caudoviricetes sp.]